MWCCMEFFRYIYIYIYINEAVQDDIDLFTLAMYLANLARDPSNPIPVQPSSSAILAVFMLIGVFGLTYVRTKFAQGK